MAEIPDCDCDERSRNGFVRIRINIPGLQPNNKTSAKNATIDPQFGPRFYRIDVNCDGTKYTKEKSWDCEFDIVPSQCLIEVERNFVMVFLKKTKPSEKCERYFSELI